MSQAPADAAAQADDSGFQRNLESVPSGAFALAGVAVALLLAAWLLIYFAVFLPRGPVG